MRPDRHHQNASMVYLCLQPTGANRSDQGCSTAACKEPSESAAARAFCYHHQVQRPVQASIALPSDTPGRLSDAAESYRFPASSLFRPRPNPRPDIGRAPGNAARAEMTLAWEQALFHVFVYRRPREAGFGLYDLNAPQLIVHGQGTRTADFRWFRPFCEVEQVRQRHRPAQCASLNLLSAAHHGKPSSGFPATVPASLRRVLMRLGPSSCDLSAGVSQRLRSPSGIAVGQVPAPLGVRFPGAAA